MKLLSIFSNVVLIIGAVKAAATCSNTACVEVDIKESDYQNNGVNTTAIFTHAKDYFEDVQSIISRVTGKDIRNATIHFAQIVRKFQNHSNINVNKNKLSDEFFNKLPKSFSLVERETNSVSNHTSLDSWVKAQFKFIRSKTFKLDPEFKHDCKFIWNNREYIKSIVIPALTRPVDDQNQVLVARDGSMMSKAREQIVTTILTIIIALIAPFAISIIIFSGTLSAMWHYIFPF